MSRMTDTPTEAETVLRRIRSLDPTLKPKMAAYVRHDIYDELVKDGPEPTIIDGVLCYRDEPDPVRFVPFSYPAWPPPA